MSSLQKMFPSLTLFSDLNWDDVQKEYETTAIDLSFPEYLQQKAEEGDCPFHLFELAFYEMALFEVKTTDEPFPHSPGVHLNPTALFLSLEFDVATMIDKAKAGEIDIIERSHVLCLFRDKQDRVRSVELDEPALEMLESLEDGPQPDSSFVKKEMKSRYSEMVKYGLVFDI